MGPCYLYMLVLWRSHRLPSIPNLWALSTFASLNISYKLIPMIDYSPASPSEMDWSKHFPAFVDTQAQALASTTSTSPPAMTKQVEIADIGCGFGGLLVALSPLFPQTLMLGASSSNTLSPSSTPP